MTSSGEGRWSEVDALFRSALELDPEDRAAFVEAACGGDDELREAVSELLETESVSSGFLARPVDALTTVPWDEVLAEVDGGADIPGRSADEPDRRGERIGPYRLVEKLGRGGMATVYLAERADGLWEQQVALKLIRRGLDTRDVVRRFLSERQILSSLDHPNIARLLDGGTTEEGLPYLVMEHVEGTPITDYCDAHELTVEERLRLFCDVGRAVQHAHRSLVVHRDLKPSNILVTDDGRVKLLDFGIAKILDPAEEGSRTRTRFRPLTPEYASPEQVAGGQVTTASDVYQLGLLLCELLSGHRPYETRRLLSPARLEAHLDRVDPAKPSTLVDASAAEARSLPLERLARRLEGDLDTVVLEAIPKEPDRRYPSAEALVADIERHLAGLPITARPPTLVYRGRKLLRRRPWLLPAVAAVLLVLAGWVFTLARHSSQLERERNLARAEAERAEEVQRFLVDVFRSVDPYATNGEVDRDITVREALTLGANRVRTELRDRPALQSSLLASIGDVYANLDLLGPARELREESLGLQRRVHGPRSAEVGRGLRKLGELMTLEGRYDSAQALLTRSLELTRGSGVPADTAVAGVLTDLGELASRRGDVTEAEDHLIDAVELLRGREPLPAPQLAESYTLLSSVFVQQDRQVEARAAAEEAVRLSRIAYGDGHPRTAIALYELADLDDWAGRHGDAVPTYREAIEILDGTLGPDHERTLQARSNLAVTLRNLGQLEEAETVHRQIVEAWRSKPARRDVALADALQNLAVVLYEAGKLEEAERRLTAARDLYDGALDPQHYKRAYPRLTLTSVRLERRDYAGAERSARRATEILEAALPATSYVTATARCRLGRALAGQGRRGEARTLLESGVDALAETAQPSARYELECRRALVGLYRDLGRDDLARPQLAEIRGLERQEGAGTS